MTVAYTDIRSGYYSGEWKAHDYIASPSLIEAY